MPEVRRLITDELGLRRLQRRIAADLERMSPEERDLALRLLDEHERAWCERKLKGVKP